MANEIRVGDRVRFKPWAEIVKIVLVDNNPQFLNQAIYALQKMRPFCGAEGVVENIFNFSGEKVLMVGDFSIENPPFTKGEFSKEFLEKVEVEVEDVK